MRNSNSGMLWRLTVAALLAVPAHAGPADGFAPGEQPHAARKAPVTQPRHWPTLARALADRDGHTAAAAPAPDPAPDPEPEAKALAEAYQARKALAVDPAIAVRDDKAPEVTLPGVLKIEGADKDALDPGRVRKVSWTNYGTVTVYVSATDTNRIQLPFPNPHVIATSKVQVEKRESSNNVYVFFTSTSPEPVQMWIEPPGEASASVGLQLVPKAIPAQTIVVVDDTSPLSATRGAQRGSREASAFESISERLAAAALGKPVPGYALADLGAPVVGLNGLVVEGVRRLSSRADDIFVYRVTNPGSTAAVIREEEFDGADVAAVSIVPTARLEPGAQTNVVVLSKKREGR